MRYLCTAGIFHDWSDDQPDPGGVPPLKPCPQHSSTQRMQCEHPNLANTPKGKEEEEEKQNP